MCGTDPCFALYADDAVRAAPLDRTVDRCAEVAATRRVALHVRATGGRVRLQARLLSGEGIILELGPEAARSVGVCLARAADDAAAALAATTSGPAGAATRPAVAKAG